MTAGWRELDDSAVLVERFSRGARRRTGRAAATALALAGFSLGSFRRAASARGAPSAKPAVWPRQASGFLVGLLRVSGRCRRGTRRLWSFQRQKVDETIVWPMCWPWGQDLRSPGGSVGFPEPSPFISIAALADGSRWLGDSTPLLRSRSAKSRAGAKAPAARPRGANGQTQVFAKKRTRAQPRSRCAWAACRCRSEGVMILIGRQGFRSGEKNGAPCWREVRSDA